MKKLLCLFLVQMLFTITLFGQHIQFSNAGTINRFTRIPPPDIFTESTFLNKVTATNISVDYEPTEFPDGAKTAIRYALNILQSIINSSQEIKVKAIWSENLPANSLAGTHPTAYIKNFPNASEQNIFYSISLAEKIDNRQLNKNSFNDPNYLLIDNVYWDYDIVIEFNSSSGWYYGTDGFTPAGKYDLVTVALHEMLHGIGFDHSFDYNKNNNIGSWGLGATENAVIYDEYLKTGAGKYLINETAFENNSEDLGSELVGDNIFFSGTFANLMALDGFPKIYAPTEWSGGSSLSHLDESTYMAGTSNSLMSPTIDPAEAIHSPGEISFGILKDVGWSVNRNITSIKPEIGSSWKRGETYSLEWSDTESGYITLSLFDENNNYKEWIANVESNIGSNNELLFTVPSDLQSGKYRIKYHELGNHSGSGFGLSLAFQISDLEQVAKPEFNYISDSYADPINLEINCQTEGATIYYTIGEGATPDENSTIYNNSPIQISSSMTINAIAYKDGFSPSIIATATYTIQNPVADIVFFPKGGNYRNNNVYLATKLNDCELRYTTNGSTPLISSNLYTYHGNGIVLYNGANTVKVRAFRNGQPITEVISQYYNISSDYNSFATCLFSQIDGSGVNLNDYSIWDDELNDWMNFPNGVLFVDLENNKDYIFKGFPNFKPGTTNKFYKSADITNNIESYKNHETFTINMNGDHYYNHKTTLKKAENASVKILYDGYELNRSFWIQDPWFKKETSEYLDSPYGYRNLGQDIGDSWEEVSSPLSLTTSSNYQGVFLGQDYSNPNNPYYSIKTTSPQTISINGTDRTFYFQNWEASNNGADAAFKNANSLETPVVFIKDSAKVQAIFKGNLISSSQDGFSNNGQRKIVTDENGYLHMVYESLDMIWYTRSTNQGISWSKEIKINLTGNKAKSPSISCSNDGKNLIYIIYQSNKDNLGLPSPSIILTQYVNMDKRWSRDVISISDYNINTKPVVTSMNGLVFTVFKENNNVGLKGIEYAINYLNNVSNENFRTIPNTDQNSSNPSLVCSHANQKYDVPQKLDKK